MNNVRKLWENSNITGLYPDLAVSARFDEPMSEHTTFRVGGPADLYVEPSSREELASLIGFFADAGVPVSILGGGSNLLVSDRGIRGAVLSLAAFNLVERLETRPAALPATRPATRPGDPESLGDAGDADAFLIRAGSGASMKELTEWCCLHGASGLERFAGLPGSVGGAVFMNARCYDISVSDVFFQAEVLYFRDGRCTLETRQFDPAAWGYKRSPFQRRVGSDPLVVGQDTEIVLSATFRVHRGQTGEIREQMDSYIADREQKGHYRFPSAGSMFKNNHAFGKPSGRIIDESGLRGFSVGDAQVAPWHGNIVINTGHARASDLRRLVDEVRRRVREQTGFDLEPEVIFAGDWQE